MARRIEDFELDPAVVVIPEDCALTMDEWLAGLRHDEPFELEVSGAELVSEARAEQQ